MIIQVNITFSREDHDTWILIKCPPVPFLSLTAEDLSQKEELEGRLSRLTGYTVKLEPAMQGWKLEIGDKVHWWGWRDGKPRCHRGYIRQISENDQFARVECLCCAMPIQNFDIKRLRVGWNNWKDEEGRLIE